MATNRFVNVNGGEWNTAANWLLDDDGTTARVPLSTDDVVITASLNAGQTITITTTNASAKSVDFSTAGNAFTLSGSPHLYCNGSLTCKTGMTWSQTGRLFVGYNTAGANTLTTNAVTLNCIWFVFNARTGASLTLQDNITFGNAEIRVVCWSGTNSITFDTNGKTITGGTSFSDGAQVGTVTLTLGSSTINCTNVSFAAATLTVSDNTATINVTSTVDITSHLGGVAWGTGGDTTFVYSITGGKVLTLSGANTVNKLKVSWTTDSDVSALVLSANQTMSNATADAFEVVGSTTGNYPEIRSSVLGTARTITAATVTITNRIGFMDITGAGAGSWDLSAIESGDCGGNSGITFATATPQYWHVDAGSWSNAAKWFTATNGGGSAGRVPLPQDNVIFDASSIDTASQTITCDCARMGASIDFEAIDVATTTITISGTKSVYGGIKLYGSGTTTIGTLNMRGRGGGTWQFKSNSKVLNSGIYILMPGTTLQLADAISLGAGSIYAQNGSFDSNNQNITAVLYAVYATFTMTTLGTETISLSRTSGYPLGIAGALTCNSANTIKFTGVLVGEATLSGSGYTFGNFWNATTGAFAVNMPGSNTFNDFKIDAGRTQTFTKDTTTTVTTFTADGTASAITIGCATTAGGDHFHLSDASGTNTAINCTISRSQAGGGASWLTQSCTDGGNNTGWVFANALPAIMNFYRQLRRAA